MQSLVQRDLARYGLKTSSQELRRFLGMLAHVHGGLLNATELGRSLGVTYHTIGGYLLENLERIPGDGTVITLNEGTYTILKTHRQRIVSLRFQPAAADEA